MKYDHNSEINYKVIGKKNEKGETIPLDEIDKMYIESFHYGKISFSLPSAWN